MRATYLQNSMRLVEYDALSRRLWIFGQRCHHGATGSVVAVTAFLALLSDQAPVATPHVGARPVLALTAAGGALMVLAVVVLGACGGGPLPGVPRGASLARGSATQPPAAAARRDRTGGLCARVRSHAGRCGHAHG